MPKCPKCEKDIRELGYSASSMETGVYSNEETQPTDTSEYEFIDFSCLEYGEILFQTEEDAIKFLKGD